MIILRVTLTFTVLIVNNWLYNASAFTQDGKWRIKEQCWKNDRIWRKAVGSWRIFARSCYAYSALRYFPFLHFHRRWLAPPQKHPVCALVHRTWYCFSPTHHHYHNEKHSFSDGQVMGFTGAKPTDANVFPCTLRRVSVRWSVLVSYIPCSIPCKTRHKAPKKLICNIYATVW